MREFEVLLFRAKTQSFLSVCLKFDTIEKVREHVPIEFPNWSIVTYARK